MPWSGNSIPGPRRGHTVINRAAGSASGGASSHQVGGTTSSLAESHHYVCFLPARFHNDGRRCKSTTAFNGEGYVGDNHTR